MLNNILKKFSMILWKLFQNRENAIMKVALFFIRVCESYFWICVFY